MGQTRRLLRAAASVYGLGALVGGVPALLVVAVGWPLPRGLPSPDQVRAALGDGWRPDERFVLCLLALVFWVLWAQLLRHVGGQLRVELRARRAGLVAAPAVALATVSTTGGRGPSQRLARWLVSGLMMAGPLVPSAAMAGPAPRIPVVLDVSHAMADPVVGPTGAASAAEPGACCAGRPELRGSHLGRAPRLPVEHRRPLPRRSLPLDRDSRPERRAGAGRRPPPWR